MDKIIEKFIEEPEREFYIRELAKISRKSPTTVSKYTHKLKKEGLLLSKKLSNHVFFKANSENINFRTLKREHNLRKLASSNLINFLEEKLNNPEAITLFGSFAKGEDIPESDIDILVITSVKKEIALGRFKRFLKRDIQLFLKSRKEIELMKKNNKELLNNFLNGAVVYGFWEVFR